MKLITTITFALALTAPAIAQIVTGTLTGHVSDPSGAAVAEGSVELREPATARVRTTVTDAQGEFVLGGLDPGDYTLSISQKGFKKYLRSDIHVDAGDRVVLGDLKMELGAISETVSVSGEMGSVVASQSSERSDLISSRQVEGLLNLGRNTAALVELLPGVVLTATSDSLGRTTTFNATGSRSTMNSISVDGLPSTDVGNAVDMKISVSEDAVSEVKVLLSNYQAEYGRAAGANVIIVTKSGTRDFHGLGSYYKRNEEFNANNFFNNLNGIPIPRYRYNAWTYNVGGPVYIPGRWNRQKDKLFFFWGQEFWPIRTSISGSLTTPTALERSGDFSQSLDVSNRLIPIRDPLTGQPFPGNVIPADRLDKNGQALMNVQPLPNFLNRNITRGNYNYVFTTEDTNPTQTNTLKIDYVFNEKNSVVFNYNAYNENHTGALNGSSGTNSANWPEYAYSYYAHTTGLTSRYTHVFTPTLLNEFQVGWMHLPEGNTYQPADVQSNLRSTVGFTLGQFYPANNPLGIIPGASFGGVPNAAKNYYDGRYPLYGITDIVNFDEKLTWNKAGHTFKAGAYIEWFQRNIGQAVDFAGNFDFSANASNPLDTGYAYSNAALGVFNTYDEANARSYPRSVDFLMELFVQDNWRVTRRLTLDYGMRLYYDPAIVERTNQLAGFAPSLYDPSQRVSLISPSLNAAGQRIGINPANGQTYPASLIGAIAPGSGNPFDGMVVTAQDSSYPRALTATHAWNPGPRFGFAYDVFGNGKTAIRGGFGLFFNRPNFGTWLRPYNANPPLVQTPVVYYGTMSTLLSSSGLLSPGNVSGWDPHAKLPEVMDFSLSVQHNLGWGTVLDVGYVGSLGRHLLWVQPINAIPFGADFNPKNADSTAGGKPLPPQFLRPIVGYNNINIMEPGSSSNYHSLQVTVNRRFQKGLQVGGSWTWSRAMDYNDSDTDTISAFIPVRVYSYSMATFDRTHNLVVNWLWDVPGPHSPNRLVKETLGGWQISGVDSFISGAPTAVGFTTTTALDITGSPTDTARINVIGNPILPKSQRTFYKNFNTAAFALPAIGTAGDAPRTVIRGPGVNNWNVAVFKNFPLVKERVKLQFRSEFYNAFNHTQFTAWNTTARFDPNGNQLNTGFGQATTAAPARIVQFSLRAYF